jgi:UDP-N-acetyl-D-glucosamine dehydrogenase
MSKIAVIGQGYVGLPLAVKSAESGHTVIGFDIDADKIANINNGLVNSPEIDKGLVKDLITNGLYVATNNPEYISDCEIIVLAVPTPLDHLGNPDLSFLKSASVLVAKNCSSKTLIINESTSYPGTLRRLILPIFKEYLKNDILFASAPERVDPANPTWNLNNTPRIISGLSQDAIDKSFEFYSSFCQNVQIVETPEIAEAAKLFENTFRMVNIALVNEFALICKKLDIPPHQVLDAAATKPFGFMKFVPGIGVGGHCIPVDPIYLMDAAESAGAESSLIKLSFNMNKAMPRNIIELIKNELGRKLRDRKIQIVGLAYKPNVPDTRESPVINLIEGLKNEGVEVIWHDPVVKKYGSENSSSLRLDIDLGLILTPHSIIDFTPWKNSNVRVLDFSANSKNYGWPKYF